jgi:hypothetical protein
MEGNYDKIVEKIASVSGLEKDELERRIEAKRAKLSGLISREGAAQVIAAELGVSFDNAKLKIDELLPGMRKITVTGQVTRLFPVRSFTTKAGKAGKVANMVIADDTSNIKVVLWDVNHIELIEKGDVAEGKVVEISNGGMRENEIHLGSFSEFKLSDEVFEKLNTERVVHEKNIVDFKISDNASVRAFVVQSFDPRFFNVCPECKKKPETEGENFICGEHGKIIPDKRALVNIVLDDGTESIRAVIFHDNLAGVGLTELEDANLLAQQRQNLLGKEMIFSGNVRNNKFFNNPEFIIDGAQEINLDELIAKFEKN